MVQVGTYQTCIRFLKGKGHLVPPRNKDSGRSRECRQFLTTLAAFPMCEVAAGTAASHSNTVALLRCFARVLRSFDLGNHELERFGHVGVIRRAGLGESALEPLGQLAALLEAHLALLRTQVALVAHYDDRHRFYPLLAT